MTVVVPVPLTFHYLLGPVLGLVVVGGLILLSRWVFGTGRDRADEPGLPPDYGLLVPVGRPVSEADAQLLRERLAEHGIRGTIAAAGHGYGADGRPWPARAQHVLVFPGDAEQARTLVRS